MKQIYSLIRKELDSYFGSPMALIFMGTFLAVTLFTFFWIDTFWARGLADVRPLFRWMPLLLIFLVATLTMRQWSEEQRAGTLEVLYTLPISTTQMVVAKFCSVLIMVLVALLLTLPLPITVSLLGDLDWGPVWSGYLAAVALAAAYTAIGLFLSSRTDNQIVALIATAVLGGLFYLVGTRGATDYVNNQISNVMRALGTGSRFESIERGVIDLRDVLYYLSLTLTFLMLNVLSLDSKRWGRGPRTRPKRLRQLLVAGLLAANLALANIWLYPLHGLRVDVTESRAYSLAPATVALLGALQEPLLLRAYISSRTHPLLVPLVPRIEDMLREYEIASGGRVIGDVVDPTTDPEMEAEAIQTYGIQATPFQVADRYEASVINSYFDILIRYGDQSVILGFADLIEVQSNREGSIDVGLRNLEYDLTSAIKKVVYGFQSVDAVLAALDEPLHLRLLVTPALLPPSIQDAPFTIAAVAQEIAAESNGKFIFEMIDPDAEGALLNRQMILDTYGLQPFPVSFFSAESYYLHMLLHMGDQVQILYTAGDLSEANVRTAIESALRRSTPGFLKAVGLWTPMPAPPTNVFGQPQQSISSWNLLREQLSNEYTVRSVDLQNGQVPDDIDMLLVVAPQNMDDKERFAIDQYLMRGGSVVMAAGNYTVIPDPFTGSLGLAPVAEGLREMLGHYGIHVQEALLLDPQNEPFPITVNRQASGFTVQEIQAIDYPFFVDIRSDGMERNNPMLAGLHAATLNWVSPIVLDEEQDTLGEGAAAERETSVLLRSTDQSWLRTDINIQPDFELYPTYGFPVEGEQQAHVVAVSVQGVFESFFKDRPSPWVDVDTSSGTPEEQPTSFLEASSTNARLVVFGSAEFVNDFVLELSRMLLTQDRFLNNLLLLQNAVDWSMEDLDLLTIRARGSNVRILDPLTPQEQSMWEFINYALALLALLCIAALWGWRKRQEQPMYLETTQQSFHERPAGS